MDGNLPVVVPHPGPRQAPAQPGLPNIFSNGQGPVYQPGGGLAASASHVIENTVEYGPEITGPNAGGPAASGVGQPQVQPQPPQINGQPSSHPHPQAPGLPVPPQYQGKIDKLALYSPLYSLVVACYTLNHYSLNHP